MKSMMRWRFFDYRYWNAILRFLNQLQRACDSNGVSEGVTWGMRLSVMNESPRVSFNNLIVPIEDGGDVYVRLKAGGDKIDTYVEGIHHLLKSYVTNANITKDSFDISRTRKIHNVWAVDFADAACLKSFMRENAYQSEAVREVFIQRLLWAICSRVRMFRGRELEAYFAEFSQYVANLLNKQLG